MNTDWTGPDPQRGDFDTELSTIDARHIERHAPVPDAKLSILVSVEGDDAKWLERLAASRGKNGDVVAELLRAADRSAA